MARPPDRSRVDCGAVDDAGPPQRVDVAALVAEIEAEVARRQAAREYPEELLARLRTEFRHADRDLPLDALAHLETVRPLESRRRYLGGLAVAAKRLVRRAIAWYVRPIAEDQSRFNFAVLRELERLRAEVQRLDVPWERPQGTPPREAGAARLGIDLVAARRDLLAEVARNAPPGNILVLEAGDGAMCDGLRDHPVEVTAADPALASACLAKGLRCHTVPPLVHLEAVPAASLAMVAVPGLLDVLPAHDLLRLCPLIATRLREGGVVVVDGPDPHLGDAPRHPADIDVAACRWLDAETVAALCRAADLDVVARLALGPRDDRGVAPWYAVVARR